MRAQLQDRMLRAARKLSHTCSVGMAAHLHAIDGILHCEVVQYLEQHFHHILSPIEVVIVQHHTVGSGPLLSSALPASSTSA